MVLTVEPLWSRAPDDERDGYGVGEVRVHRIGHDAGEAYVLRDGHGGGEAYEVDDVPEFPAVPAVLAGCAPVVVPPENRARSLAPALDG